jgi:hypothetical protein
MHGEISSNRRRTAAYYACHAARRNRSAAMPRGPPCDAQWIAANLLDDALRNELPPPRQPPTTLSGVAHSSWT